MSLSAFDVYDTVSVPFTPLDFAFLKFIDWDRVLGRLCFVVFLIQSLAARIFLAFMTVIQSLRPQFYSQYFRKGSIYNRKHISRETSYQLHYKAGRFEHSFLTFSHPKLSESPLDDRVIFGGCDLPDYSFSSDKEIVLRAYNRR